MDSTLVVSRPATPTRESREDAKGITSKGRSGAAHEYLWTAAVLTVTVPIVVVLAHTLWRTPFPISEAVAIFEDVENRPPTRFLVPDTSYYRPLFYLTLSALWHHAGSLDATLAAIKLVQIIPVAVLIVGFIGYLRPRTLLDAAAATLAVAVLVGSPGFRDNLELPLSYTTVGMPIALIVWILVTRQPRPWHAPLIVVLTVIGIGFKEQGLVLVPLVVAMRWLGAPGASRGLTVTMTVMGVAYVALRFAERGAWPLFGQAVGLGFHELEPPEATARFGAFPYWIYGYNAASTVSNVLFSEPTRGVFRIVRDVMAGYSAPWEHLQLGSSMAVTGLIAWWGTSAVKRGADGRWSSEARVVAALIVVLVASGVLSFNYSRDRLGGMAAVFYTIATFFAVRAALEWAVTRSRACMLTVALALSLLAAAWQTRVLFTLEYARYTSAHNRTEWLTELPQRRLEFAGRDVYLRIMHSMIEQGTRPDAPQPTRYPRWINLMLGLP